MVPIHDTDVGSERWAQEEWENYELWEKVEVRLRRQKRLWIFATALVFVVLSGIPIVIDRWPKWSSRVVLRHLVQEMSKMKREAGVLRGALRLRFLDSDQLTYQIEKVSDCQTSRPGEVMNSGRLGSVSGSGLGPDQTHFVLVDSKRGDELGVPGLQAEFCYDHLTGFGAASEGKEVVGFGVISSSDLIQKRLDRMSILLLSGPSAEVSID
jgi:hypothetical protein